MTTTNMNNVSDNSNSVFSKTQTDLKIANLFHEKPLLFMATLGVVDYCIRNHIKNDTIPPAMVNICQIGVPGSETIKILDHFLQFIDGLASALPPAEGKVCVWQAWPTESDEEYPSITVEQGSLMTDWDYGETPSVILLSALGSSEPYVISLGDDMFLKHYNMEPDELARLLELAPSVLADVDFEAIANSASAAYEDRSLREARCPYGDTWLWMETVARHFCEARFSEEAVKIMRQTWIFLISEYTHVINCYNSIIYGKLREIIVSGFGQKLAIIPGDSVFVKDRKKFWRSYPAFRVEAEEEQQEMIALFQDDFIKLLGEICAEQIYESVIEALMEEEIMLDGAYRMQFPDGEADVVVLDLDRIKELQEMFCDGDSDSD